jgi:hypothetical protein
MKINKVSVTYGELRSDGYPKFSNTRHELTLEACPEVGETPRHVMEQLRSVAKNEVRKAFGDNVDNNQMDLPF